ncbi:MAG TPA: HAMP domain-containing sensor histidine kinase [Solirubrobacteraceae bacterium]|nr:HAMP domain-containing sensor histidine kinase [Solirubrobacteraceae bacterium]
MSLRRRIAAAAGLAVVAVAIAVAVIGYFSARSHLIGEIQQELRARAAPELQPHGFQGQGGGAQPGGRPGGGAGAGPRDGIRPPPNPGFGAAPGYFQVVEANGQAFAADGGRPQLPVDKGVLQLVRQGSGSFYGTAKVGGVHLEVLTVWDTFDHHAIQVALPLTAVDSVLHGLLISYSLVVAGGVLLAILLAAFISSSALAPINRFLRRTEDVTSDLIRPQRLEETGPSELRRLAMTFNQTLDALERSIDSQRHLVADASHELRTPIAALRSNIQIFLDAGRLPPEERVSLQESILAELDELTQIVADVVELARGTQPSTDRESIELDSVVRDAIQRTQRRAPQLRFQLDLEPTVIEGAPDQISRAVSNVIDNARKWSPPDGQIEVSLRRGELSVRDHGPGFQDRDLPHVFDRFYRADNARRLPGAGLGLAIVKQAAETHGGQAEARNAADGGGVVTVSFAAAPS